jgi:hypothetical protein
MTAFPHMLYFSDCGLWTTGGPLLFVRWSADILEEKALQKFYQALKK